MIIIPNRMMPKTCEGCPCNDDDYRCGVTGWRFDDKDEEPYEERMRDCPLIGIPDFQTFCVCDYDTLRCWDEDGHEMRLVRKGEKW